MITTSDHAVVPRPLNREAGAGGVLTTAVNQRVDTRRLCRAARPDRRPWLAGSERCCHQQLSGERDQPVDQLPSLSDVAIAGVHTEDDLEAGHPGELRNKVPIRDHRLVKERVGAPRRHRDDRVTGQGGSVESARAGKGPDVELGAWEAQVHDAERTHVGRTRAECADLLRASARHPFDVRDGLAQQGLDVVLVGGAPTYHRRGTRRCLCRRGGRGRSHRTR